LAHAGKSILKLAIVAIVTVWCLKSFEAEALAALDLEAAGLTVLLAAMAARLVGLVALAYIAVAAVDSVLAWRAWRRELRMTRQEQRDEAKEVEGDPAIKHRLRSVARQRARKRMIAAVPRATVVVANPTHFAVALRYLREEGGAPRVVAKGRDLLALKIREVAARHDIPVVEDKALARALHDAVPVDAAIPPEFYKAVARIIMVLSKAGSRLALGAS
jgi:flagellar biosynthetic protein FlhB